MVSVTEQTAISRDSSRLSSIFESRDYIMVYNYLYNTQHSADPFLSLFCVAHDITKKGGLAMQGYTTLYLCSVSLCKMVQLCGLYVCKRLHRLAPVASV